MNAVSVPLDNVPLVIPTHAVAPPPEPPDRRSGEGDGSERERLLVTWRLHPEALVDLASPEVDGGAEDGAGRVRMTEPDGNEIDEFHFVNAEAADDAVDYALRQLSPGSH